MHHHNGRWEARIGRVFGNKYLYLGTYSTQEEAARAYDIATIEYRGTNAVTNFDLSNYIRWLKPGVAAQVAAASELQAGADLQPMLAATNYFAKDESKLLNLYIDPLFATDYLTSPKEEPFAISISPNTGSNKTSSSPTALGLLLQSSVFRELVEKNSNATEEETQGGETKNQQQAGSDDEYGGIFYDGIEDIPFVFSANKDVGDLQEQELHFIF